MKIFSTIVVVLAVSIASAQVTALEESQFQSTSVTTGMSGGIAYDWDSNAASTTTPAVTKRSEWYYLQMRNQAHMSMMLTNMQVALRDMGTIMIVQTGLLAIIGVASLWRAVRS